MRAEPLDAIDNWKDFPTVLLPLVATEGKRHILFRLALVALIIPREPLLLSFPIEMPRCALAGIGHWWNVLILSIIS